MSIREDVKILLAKENVTLTEVAKRLTKKASKKVAMDNLSQKLIRGTIKFEEIRMLADVLGYDIEFKKRI